MDRNKISEQIEEIRIAAETYKQMGNRAAGKYLTEAADIMEALHVKLLVADKKLSDEGWIYCGDGKNLPEKYTDGNGCYIPFLITPKYDASEFSAVALFTGKRWKNNWGNVEVIAWRPFPEFYHHIQRTIGEDCKQQIMDRFMRAE